MIAPSKQAFVPFLSVANMMRLVHAIGVEQVMIDLAAEIEADFRRWPLFDKTPRVASHSDVGVIELMPTSDGETYGFKYVNGHPSNMKRGLQTVTAFGLLADVATGYPLLLSEMTILTALRTAATSAMAAKWLAPKGATTMALIGNGAQAEFQALAFKAVCGITEVRLYDIDPAATAKCAGNLAGSMS
jgi:ornithine cyclodeaminase